MRVVLFGGAFDPFHLAHLEMIKKTRALDIYDQIIVMPTGLSPHKQQKASFAAYRYESCRLGLISCDERVVLSDEEILYPKISYTLHTVRRLKQNFTAGKISLDLLIGSDSLLAIESWYKADQLLAETGLLVAVRDPSAQERIKEQAALLEAKYNTNISFLNIEDFSISSTKIRHFIQEGLDPAQMLPLEVSSFLTENKIYAFAKEMEGLKEDWDYLQRLEQIQWPLLEQERRVHSLNVMQYAVYLAGLHRLDKKNAAAAGLLHDIAKNLPLKEQYLYAGTDFEDLNDKIVHAPASANYVENILAINEREVLDAIRWHTTSHPEIDALGKIIFLADKIEYGRDFLSLQPIREMAKIDLDKAMLLCLEEVLIALKRDKKKIHPYSLASYRFFKEEFS